MADQTPQMIAGPAPGPGGRVPRQRGASWPGNLPLPLTSFVGREQALAAVQRLLASSRLLTLTGPGGVGKTRLALEAALAAAPGFPHGAWWVELAQLCEPSLVPQQVAVTLGLPEDPARTKEACLSDYLREKELLLVLDNCEHLAAACARLTGHLLATCPHLRILATSREILDIDGEVTWSVPPLSLPCEEESPALEALLQSEAGRLFLERARAIVPDLDMTAATLRAIAQICCRLDGIPLAIELAAARVRVISVGQIAERLDDRFRLLTGGSRSGLPHHQTLGAALDWSYDLLERPEQIVFERLGAFAGGFCLEAAEAVAGAEGPGAILPGGVLDLLSRLVAKSLVEVKEGDQARFRMLETIRQYALGRLGASGDFEQTRRRHLAYYLELARQAEEGLSGADQARWLRLLELEHDNLRTALAWSQESTAGDEGLHLAATLAAFWMRAGYLEEGSDWLRRALAACRELGPVRIKALHQAGRLCQQRGDYQEAYAYARQCLALSRRLDDLRGMARARGLMGWVAHWRGDRDEAAPLLEEALALARRSGDGRAIAKTLLVMGDLQLRRGMLEQAGASLRESLELYQAMGDGWNLAWAHGALGDLARLLGDFRGAVSHLQLSLALHQELNSRAEMPFPLEALALTWADQGEPARAARLLGAARALRDSIHSILPPSYRADYAPVVKKVQAALGSQAFLAALSEGEALPLAEALALAGAEPAPKPLPAAPVHPSGAAAGKPYGLTPRELDVLRLVAGGLTDAQVAEQLVISPRTVGKHLQSIYSKLYLPSRSAATRWAIEHDLA